MAGPKMKYTREDWVEMVRDAARRILEEEAARRELARARAPLWGRSAWKRQRDALLALSGGRLLNDQVQLEKFWDARERFFRQESDGPVRRAVEAALELELIEPCGRWALDREREVA